MLTELKNVLIKDWFSFKTEGAAKYCLPKGWLFPRIK